jgi:hypothetical protein
MNSVDPSTAIALVAAALMMLSFLVMRRRGAGRRPSRPSEPESDKFTPQAVRVMTSAEREAYKLLSQAMPGAVVLAQVPLTRFLRVQGKQGDWVRQANGLSADLLLCDAGSRVLVVVNVRSSLASEKSRRRNDTVQRLLKAAGIKVLSWSDAAMPDLSTVRNQLFAVLRAGSASRSGETNSRPMPLIPVAEILEEGDSGSPDTAMEPVPSALFDELEPDLPLPGKR